MHILAQFINHPKTIATAILLLGDSLFFSLTNPSSVPAALLIVGFGLLMTTLFMFVYGLIALLGFYGISFSKHQARFAVSATGLVAVICALQSVNELSIHDVMVLVPMALIAYVYVSYGRRPKTIS
jgi:membrane-bound ClpP family serine protease